MQPRQPAFFLQNNLVERLTAPVARFARANNIALVDRSSTQEFDPLDCGVDWSEYAPVLAYGSTQFLRKLVASGGFRPYLHVSSLAFDAATWADKLGIRMLNATGEAVELEHVAQLLSQGPRHVRPLNIDKAFVAQTFDSASWAERVLASNVDKSLACWISPVQHIAAEWRLWSVGGQLIEASQYRERGEMLLRRTAPAEVWEFAQDVLRTWSPAACVVIDIAQRENGALRVVEFNPVHSSGWYAADVPAVLRAWLGWECLRSAQPQSC